MKRYISKIFIMAALALLGTGCGKGFLTDLGNNPNQPSQAPLQLILPAVLTGYASQQITGYNGIGTWMGYYSFSGGYSIAENSLNYYESAGGPSNWGISVIVNNANYMAKTAAGQTNMDNFVAVGKILMALGYQALVDAYDYVPYTDAFHGADNFFPKYDDGKTVYAACISQLDSAISIIQSANVNAVNLGNNDIMFKGNMTKWAQFANTLKLRFLIREANVIGDAAKNEIALTTSVGYLTVDALVNPGYANTPGKQSPLWATLGVNPGGSLYSDGYNYLRAGGAMVNFYKMNNDPRLFYVYAPNGSDPSTAAFSQKDNNAGDYAGVYFGDRTTAAALGNKGVAGVGHGVMAGYAASVPLITATESYFLQSEARLKGWITDGDDAGTLYQKGITASFEYLYAQAGDKIADADVAAEQYYSQDLPNVQWDNTLKTIIIQKWASLAISNNFEAWTEYRRTGYPGADLLPMSKYPGVSTHIPVRYMFPSTEQQRNSGAYNEAVAKGNDPQNSKIFWSK
ncbi:MAG: SusD/RagB family nutrient-binding outer membrane lipoprotein [Chitinophagaceae bacterium]